MADGTDFDPREFIKFTPTQFEWHFNAAPENVNNADTALPLDVWSHNLVVKDGENFVYFRDGVEIGSSVVTGAPVNAQPLYLGGQPQNDATVEGFSGRFAEVAVFDRALSAGEVLEVYQRGLNGVALTDGGTTPVDPEPSDRVVLEDVGITASGVFGLTLPAGVTADIEYSTDLIDWEVIATDLSGALEETDAGRIAARESYYRAVPK